MPRTEHLNTITLAELNAEAGLLTRMDRKYLVPPDDVQDILDILAPRAQVLQIDGLRNFQYASTYFDTPDLDSYLLAAHKRRRRFKIRTRSYDDASGNKRYITEIYADRIEFFSLGGRRPQDAEHAGDSSVATQPADAAAEVHAFAAKSEPTPPTSASDLEPISPADADPVDDLPF